MFNVKTNVTQQSGGGAINQAPIAPSVGKKHVAGGKDSSKAATASKILAAIQEEETSESPEAPSSATVQRSTEPAQAHQTPHLIAAVLVVAQERVAEDVKSRKQAQYMLNDAEAAECNPNISS